MKKVSVIIPVYNSYSTLSKCLDSVLASTYKNLDILLLDDGSTDNSLDLCKQYAEKDSRIRVFHNGNHGVSYTRNHGLDEATGDYVMFVDSDDEVLPNMFEQYVLAAEKNNYDMLIGGIVFRQDGVDRIQLPPNEEYTGIKLLQYVINGHKGTFGLVPNKLYNREKINKNNIRFPEDTSVQEDLVFAVNAYDLLENIGQIQYAGYIYNLGANMKAASFEQLIKNRGRILKIAQKYESINLHPMISRVNDLIYGEALTKISPSELVNLKNNEFVNEYINFKSCKRIEQKCVIKLLQNNNFYVLSKYITIRQKLKKYVKRIRTNKQ